MSISSEEAQSGLVSNDDENTPAVPPPQRTSRLPEDVLRDCEQAIGHSFADPGLLEHALTHASIASVRLESNERLEFLGDAIMGSAVCEYLFQTYPTYAEGELTRIKSAVVSRQTCAKMSNRLGFERFLLLGKGLAIHDRIPSSILAAVFESIIAALYLDGGWPAANRFILSALADEIAKVARTAHGRNFKSQLQQLAQKNFNQTPIYRLIDEKGPDHSKCFQVAAAIGETLYPAAWGPNKKEAEQNAADNALKEIEGLAAVQT